MAYPDFDRAVNPAPSVDLTKSAAFIAALTGRADTIMRFRFIHDRNRERPGGEVAGAVEQVWPTVKSAQAGGYGAYYFPNQIRALPGGKFACDTDVAAFRALFADFDGGLPSTYHLPPDLIVHTSPGRGQALWILSEQITPAEFRKAQRRLIAFYAADRSCVNPARVLRLPGTLHLKDTPYLVTFANA